MMDAPDPEEAEFESVMEKVIGSAFSLMGETGGRPPGDHGLHRHAEFEAVSYTHLTLPT